VTFAGQVAGTTWVTLEVAPAVLVTLGPLRTLEWSVGQVVATGDRLGTLASGHASPDPSVAALHLGLRVDGVYVDPLPWLAGLARPRLAPLSEPGGPH
jgi:septal ring factor EnvC (AmiA/AmiB activator)